MAGAPAGPGYATRPLPTLVSASSPVGPGAGSTGNVGGQPHAVRVNRHGSITIGARDAARIGSVAGGTAAAAPAAAHLFLSDGARRVGDRGDAVRRESTSAPTWEHLGDGRTSGGARLVHFILRLVNVDGQQGVRCADGGSMERANVEVRPLSPSPPSLFLARTRSLLQHHATMCPVVDPSDTRDVHLARARAGSGEDPALR